MMGKIIDITEFERLINSSNLSKPYKLLVMQDITYVINANKGIGFNFVNNGNFLKAVEIILRSSIQDDSKYVIITSLILCLKNEDVDNNLQNKSNIVLCAILISYGVIHAYLASERPYLSCIERPNNKRSNVKMFDYLSDNQVIKEDILWLENKDLKKFKEFCGEINNIQGIEVKETFENYLNEINNEKKHSALKCAVVALATICVVTGIIAIAGKSAVVGVIAAIAGIMLSACLLCSNKLECVNVTRKSKECASHNSNFFVGL
ncbi:hypothetical protein [Wolbachia endosymbiont of Cantharis cryptica]|uniref:hypothetical protein n=1 Tax=Wolbachia endosymbiont of Cantharis cryptica TaxID=3066132 RepID=UPI00376EDA2E